MTIQYMEIVDENEWLEKRKSYVTSTEVASLYGAQASYAPTAYELWHIKHGNISVPDISNNEFILFGKLMEPVIVAMVKIQKPDWEIKDCNLFAYDDEDKIGSSFDREVNIKGRKGLFEIKTTSYKYYKQEFEEEAPVHYEIQCQTELEMMPDAEFIVIATFIADTRSIEYIFRERDSEMGRCIRESVREFWNMDSPPDVDYSKDKSVLAKVAPKCDPHRIMDATENSRITELAEMYKSERELEKQSKDNADKFYAELMDIIGTAKYVWTENHKITVSDIKANEGKEITPDMVGKKIGERTGFKKITVTEITK